MLDVDTQFTAVLARCRNTSRLSWLAILMDVLVSSMRMCLLPGALLTALIIASGALTTAVADAPLRLSPLLTTFVSSREPRKTLPT